MQTQAIVVNPFIAMMSEKEKEAYYQSRRLEAKWKEIRDKLVMIQTVCHDAWLELMELQEKIECPSYEQFHFDTEGLERGEA